MAYQLSEGWSAERDTSRLNQEIGARELMIALIDPDGNEVTKDRLILHRRSTEWVIQPGSMRGQMGSAEARGRAFVFDELASVADEFNRAGI